MRFLKGELSVFFALITVLCAALVLSAVESVRTEATRAYLTIAADSAIDSLFSQYHRELWDRYRLLGLEMYSEEEICSEYFGFFHPYLSGGTTKNWYCLSGRKDGVSVLDCTLLPDDGGEVFEKEVVDYMKYGIAAEVPDLLSVQESIKAFTEGKSVQGITSEFSDCAELCGELEDIVSEIGRELKNEETAAARMERAVDGRDAGSVGEEADALYEVYDSLTSLCETYRETAQKLRESLLESRENLEEEKRSGNLSEDACRSLQSDISCYDSYLSEDGERSEGILAIPSEVSENRRVVRETEELAEEAEAFIDGFVPEEVIIGYDPPLTEGGPPEPIYGETSIDEEEVWEPVRDAFSEYCPIRLDLSERKPDAEKKAQLENAAALLKGDLLPLLLPDGVIVSESPLPLEDRPSEKYTASGRTGMKNPADLLFVTEYDLRVMNDFSKNPDTLETEYILCGKESDAENLKALLAELLTVRSGLNLLYLLSDSEKKAEARALAAAVTGVASVTPLAEVTMFFILGIWAFGQAVLDGRDLLSGGKVPVMHDRESFRLSLGGLLSDFRGTVKTPGTGNAGEDYEGVLRLFLFQHGGSETSLRALDCIQMNLRKGQPDFLAERLYTSLSISASAFSRHLFSMILTPGALSDSYPVTVSSYYSY